MPVLGRRHLLVVLSAVALGATGCSNPASTTDAGEDEFDDFLPVAEEILAGISFPDLESG